MRTTGKSNQPAKGKWTVGNEKQPAQGSDVFLSDPNMGVPVNNPERFPNLYSEKQYAAFFKQKKLHFERVIKWDKIPSNLRRMIRPKLKQRCHYAKAIEDKSWPDNRGILDWDKILKKIVVPNSEWNVGTNNNPVVDLAILIWTVLEGKSVFLPRIIRESMYRVHYVGRKKAEFSYLIAKRARKARVEWDDDNYVPEIPGKEKKIPYRKWLKNEMQSSKKQKHGSTTAEGLTSSAVAQPPTAAPQPPTSLPVASASDL
ncbi:hypothetical protein AHAS_Ahas17G0205500 [Arachis hypogaea]